MISSKKILMVLAAAAGMTLAAETPNMLTNGDFESKGHYWTDYSKGMWKTSIVVDEATKSKCFKMELTGFNKNKKGTRAVGGAMYIGRNGRNVGVLIKPDTEYEVTFQVKGDIGKVTLQAITFDELTRSQWVKTRKRIKVSQGGFTYNDKEWTTCKATFRTGKTAKTALLALSQWGDESQEKKFIFELGKYFMLDNITLRELPAAAAK